ncbi:MAG TPA: hypothetical protein VFH43_12475 [Candidatus Kapabacteria bacterium]|nr:hypothetical protein [Candidatus Kapabacteria bacterium]
MSEKEGDSVTLYEPDEMIIIVKPEITLAELDRTLNDDGQWIATLLPDEREEVRLGDALAHNSYHPRARFGSPLATSVLGGTFQTHSGEIFKSGSRVVKSVAGYDTHRAFVGSEGRLFKPLELTLKVMPRPKEFLRFTAPLSMRTKLMQRQPTIVEEWNGEFVIEFAGQHEDMADDRAWLASEGLAHSEITDGWGELIRKISHERDTAMRAQAIDPKALQLLEQLRERINS